MIKIISIKEALNKSNNKNDNDKNGTIFIDTRSPKEFEEDCLPNAINLPIFSDDERAIVGTIYKQKSKELAIEKGVEIFSTKLPHFMKEVSKYKDKEIIVNCWRGGMRSKTVVSLLDSLGYNTLQLEGGYKAYRAYVKERLYNYQFKPKLVVLYGLTCTGKTELLLKFANSIDLEGLAQHRSSLYGAIGLVPNSQKKFESLLLQKLDELNQEKWVIIEGESRRIGNVIIPELLWKSMKKGVNGHIKRSIENRAKAGVAEYLNTEEKQKGVLEVTKRLFKVISKQKKEEIITNLEEKKYFEAVKILLEFYYDPLYSHTLKSVKFDFEVDNDNVLEGIERINENDYRFE